MSNSGKSEKGKDFWGNEYTKHYDADGNSAGKSEDTTDFWGNEYTQHYDADGNTTGKSEQNTDFWGNKYTKHYDADGNSAGKSENTSDIWGNKYTKHYDADGNTIGRSENTSDIWGNKYTKHTGTNRYTSKYIPPDDSSGNSALVYLVVVIAVIIGAIWLIGVVLKFTFSILIPLLIINTAIISFALIYFLSLAATRKSLYYLIPILGGLYVFLDANYGLLMPTLYSNGYDYGIHAIYDIVKYAFYINLITGLIAAYIFISGHYPKAGIWSKQSLIILGILVTLGSVAIAITTGVYK